MEKENWYKKLLLIHQDTPIESITASVTINKWDVNEVTEKASGNLEDVKKIMDYDFDPGYGGTEGPSFTAWTKDRVYFPVQYDGSEWIESVARNPCDEAKEHVGGG